MFKINVYTMSPISHWTLQNILVIFICIGRFNKNACFILQAIVAVLPLQHFIFVNQYFLRLVIMECLQRNNEY